MEEMDHGYLHSMKFSILINGQLRGRIRATKGLKQEDPLSLFLFTLMVDRLFRLMSKTIDASLMKRILVGKVETGVSYLQFVDGTLVFTSSDQQNIDNLLKVIDIFCLISKLKVNKTKSVIVEINSLKENLKTSTTHFDSVENWPLKCLSLP